MRLVSPVRKGLLFFLIWAFNDNLPNLRTFCKLNDNSQFRNRLLKKFNKIWIRHWEIPKWSFKIWIKRLNLYQKMKILSNLTGSNNLIIRWVIIWENLVKWIKNKCSLWWVESIKIWEAPTSIGKDPNFWITWNIWIKGKKTNLVKFQLAWIVMTLVKLSWRIKWEPRTTEPNIKSNPIFQGTRHILLMLFPKSLRL